MPRPTVAPVALVTVRARRMRVFPTPLEISQRELPDLGWLTPAPIEDDAPAPLIDFPGIGVIVDPATTGDPTPDLSEDLVVAELEAFEVPAPRPRHSPPPKISLKDVPSGMEQLAERWRGAP